MDTKLTDKDNRSPKGIRILVGTVGLFFSRVVICIGVLIVLYIALLWIPYIRSAIGVFLAAVFMMSIFAGIDYLTGKVISRFLKLPLLLRSLGCFPVVLGLVLLMGILDFTAALAEKPYILPQKDVDNFVYHDQKDNISVGTTAIYDEGHLQRDVFQGKDVFAIYTLSPCSCNLVAVELLVFNNTGNSIEIAPTDLTLEFRSQSVDAEVVDAETAQEHLRTFGGLLSGTDGTFSPLPSDVVVFSPFLVSLAPSDYLWLRNWKETFRLNAFQYGEIVSSETRQGFVYFEIPYEARALVTSSESMTDIFSLSGWVVSL